MSKNYLLTLGSGPRYRLSLHDTTIEHVRPGGGPAVAGVHLGADGFARKLEGSVYTLLDSLTDWIDDRTLDLTRFEVIATATGDLPLDAGSAALNEPITLGISGLLWKVTEATVGQVSAVVITLTVYEVLRPVRQAVGVYTLIAEKT